MADTPIPQETTIMETTLNVAAAESFREASNTGEMATNDHETIDFEAEYLLLMNEPSYEINYNAVATILTNNTTAPYKPTKDKMNNSRQSKVAGSSIKNNDNRNHRISSEWNTKNYYENHATGILKSPVLYEQYNDAMNESRQSKAADMSTCNHDNQNNNIYNEWNTIADVAVGIDIKATTPMIIRKTKTTMNRIQKPMWQLTLT